MTVNPSFYPINFNSITRFSGLGNQASTIHNILRNKNWAGGPALTEPLKEHNGLVFIGPPDLNLQPETVGHIREFSPLLIENPVSLGSTIRDMLDPRGAFSRPNSILNDPKYPFLGLLDNTLISLDGWPDWVMEEYVSPPGKFGSSWSVSSGTIKKHQKFNLTATHQNIPGNGVNDLYRYLLLWKNHVHYNTATPYMRNIRYNRMDYVMRIYRLIFDSTGTRVNQFTMCSYGHPLNDNSGKAMNYNIEKPLQDTYDNITVNWSCVGVWHNDPIVIECFNRLVQRFNSDMRDDVRNDRMVRLGVEERSASLAAIEGFQYQGYPRINPLTLEFEIWLPKEIYRYLAKGILEEEILLAIERRRDEEFYWAYRGLTSEEQLLITT